MRQIMRRCIGAYQRPRQYVRRLPWTSKGRIGRPHSEDAELKRNRTLRRLEVHTRVQARTIGKSSYGDRFQYLHGQKVSGRSMITPIVMSKH